MKKMIVYSSKHRRDQPNKPCHSEARRAVGISRWNGRNAMQCCRWYQEIATSGQSPSSQ